MRAPLFFRLLGPIDTVIAIDRARAWVLARQGGAERWEAFDPPPALAGQVLTESAVRALVARVGMPAGVES